MTHSTEVITETAPATVGLTNQETLALKLDKMCRDVFTEKGMLKHGAYKSAIFEMGPVEAGPGRSLWFYQDGVWLPDAEDEVRRRSEAVLGDRWNATRAEQAVKSLQHLVPVIPATPPKQWINCRNGLLDWKTGELHPHTPDVPSTYQLAVDWDPEATSPLVDEWLATVAPDDATNLMWEIMGQAIYPDQAVQKAILLSGEGRNGKGTFLRLIEQLVGDGPRSSVSFRDLSTNRFAAAELFGKVVNISGDLDPRSVDDTSVFKGATGQDTLTAERKHQQPFQFRSTATMIFAANALPGSADHTRGFFSRWVIVPFTKMNLQPGEEDLGLEARLHQELPGVLVKAVAGLRRVSDQEGYSDTPSVNAALGEFKSEINPVQRFLNECLTVTGSSEDLLPRTQVYESYKLWCEEEGLKRPVSAKTLWNRLQALDRLVTLVETRVIHNGTKTRQLGGVTLTEDAPSRWAPTI